MAHSLIMVLKVENLKVSGEKKEILKGVDLNIGKGEIQALIGPNASGKSTLAHVLSGNSKYKIKEGQIYFKGKNIKNYSPERRVKMGLVLSWQNPPSIKGVGFFNFLSEISKGKIDDSFVENFKERDLNLNFSGGEKKISEIAQIIALKPDLVILDEIDSGLDMEKIKEISKIIKEKILKNNVSLLLITHSCEIFNFLKPHYVNVMVGGKIICKKRDYKEVLRTIKKHGYEKCRQKISLSSS
jgi:Fe-S cluster assembly ATP-binding protein